MQHGKFVSFPTHWDCKWEKRGRRVVAEKWKRMCKMQTAPSLRRLPVCENSAELVQNEIFHPFNFHDSWEKTLKYRSPISDFHIMHMHTVIFVFSSNDMKRAFNVKLTRKTLNFTIFVTRLHIFKYCRKAPCNFCMMIFSRKSQSLLKYLLIIMKINKKSKNNVWWNPINWNYGEISHWVSECQRMNSLRAELRSFQHIRAFTTQL